jgi:hypothetical protein
MPGGGGVGAVVVSGTGRWLNSRPLSDVAGVLAVYAGDPDETRATILAGLRYAPLRAAPQVVIAT